MTRARLVIVRAAIVLATLALSTQLTHAEELSGNPARGRQVFAACRTCHYPERGYGHHNGPSLFAIFGRTAGTQPGFAYYSAWLKSAGFQWTPETLDAWLKNPGMFPDSSMIFVGIPDDQARADLIAYLVQFHE
jgi:cytochrome c